MKMKEHVLAGLREMDERWEELLASMGEEQIAQLLLPSHWTTKDVMAHLMAWQQRSIARLEGARLDREPEFPCWLPDLDPDEEDNMERANAWIYEAHREQPWSKIHRDWAEGFLRFLRSAEAISERDLLDTGKYPWLGGYSLALILLASYDHHQEHYEKLLAWLQEHGDAP